MALRDIEDEDELRVVSEKRRPGRPPDPYPRSQLDPDDEERLRKHLRHSFQREGPYPNWYVPAAHERLGDRLTLSWLDDYEARYSDDWRRMLRNTRHGGLDVAGGRGTLKGEPRLYKVWVAKTAKKKSTRDVGPPDDDGDDVGRPPRARAIWAPAAWLDPAKRQDSLEERALWSRVGVELAREKIHPRRRFFSAFRGYEVSSRLAYEDINEGQNPGDFGRLPDRSRGGIDAFLLAEKRRRIFGESLPGARAKPSFVTFVP